MKKAIFRVASLLLLTLNMLLIFSLSAQEAAESEKLSGGFTNKVFSALYPGFDEMDEQEQAQTIAKVAFPVRKTAHFSIYCLLGIFSFMTFVSYTGISFRLRAALSFVLCVLYASSDEFHQLFVKGRSGEVRDVVIDSLGALLSISLLSVITLKSGKFKKVAVKMRKKDLMSQNRTLIQKNRELNLEIKELKNSLNEKELQIKELEKIPCEDKSNFDNDNKVTTSKSVKPYTEETSAAAKAIGRIVVLCASYLNKLSGTSYSDKKELVNLILGKCESSKAEILSAATSGLSSDETLSVMDNIYKDTEEYFKNILAQTA